MARRLSLLLSLPLALGLAGCPEEDRGGRDDVQHEQTTPRSEDEDTPTYPSDEGGTGGGTTGGAGGTGGGTGGTTGDGGATGGTTGAPNQQTGPRSGSGSAGGTTRSGERGPGGSEAPRPPEDNR